MSDQPADPRKEQPATMPTMPRSFMRPRRQATLPELVVGVPLVVMAVVAGCVLRAAAAGLDQAQRSIRRVRHRAQQGRRTEA